MPVYTFKNKNTNEEFDEEMGMSKYDQFIIDHPELERIIKSVRIVSGHGDLKPDNGFRDVLKRIKKASGKENTIETF